MSLLLIQFQHIYHIVFARNNKTKKTTVVDFFLFNLIEKKITTSSYLYNLVISDYKFIMNVRRQLIKECMLYIRVLNDNGHI